MNARSPFKTLGVFWLIVGGIGIIGLVVALWQVWRTQDLPLEAFIGSLPLLIFGGAAVLNGWGLLSRKRWARWVTIVLSPILLLYSLVSFFLIGWQYGVLPLLIPVLFFIVGLYGLWLMLSERGKEAFKIYVS